MAAYLLHQLLEHSANSAPSSSALSWKGSFYSYQEIDAMANRVANSLLQKGIKRGDRVGLFLDKSPAAVVAIYGILKTGAAYVPLDVRSPMKRISHIAADCAVRGLITTSKRLLPLSQEESFLSFTKDAPLAVITLDGDFPVDTDLDPAAHRPNVAIDENDLAYILYTSGSTGLPKGVMLSHRAGLSFVNWAAEYFELSAADRVSSHAPFHFDLSTFDLFSTAAAGACVCLIPSNTMLFPRRLAEWIAEEQISIWYSAPTALTQLVLHGGLEDVNFQNLRHILFAGEVFPIKYLKQLQSLVPHANYHNLYGPSETNVCTVWSIPRKPLSDGEMIPIGKACADLEVFALNEDGGIAKVNEVGELYVFGPGVMVGYWGQPEKTEAALSPHPLQPERPGKAYRTGDLVKLAADGNYQFIGRRDHQVKSRGYRIELGEIENTLLHHPNIAEAVVIAVPDEEAGNLLHAFVVFRENSSASDSELATFCRKTLPAYMIPEAFRSMPALPLTSNGKIDRALLRTT